MFARFVITVALVFAAVQAFQPTARRFNAVRLSMSDDQSVTDLNLEQMQDMFEEADKTVSTPASSAKFDPKSEVGSSAPTGFFDPAGFTKSVSKDQYTFFQEAELKHGRVCMLSFLGIVFGEILAGGGLGHGAISGPAIYQYQQADAAVFPMTATLLLGLGYIEQQGIVKAWAPASETFKDPTGFGKLKADRTPGDYGFDPAGVMPTDQKKFNTLRTKELNNGRLAMLAVAGIVAQELVTNKSIF